MTRRTVLCSTAVLALTLGLAGCAGNTDTKATTAAANPSASAPAPTASPKYGDEPSAATATEACGAKTVVNAVAAGYKKTGSDEEPGFEADGDFEGPAAGNLNVKTLCQGNLVVTYTFNQ